MSLGLFQHLTRRSLIVGVLVNLIIIFCIGVIYSKHYTRNLMAELQSLKLITEKYEIEWSQLLLEKAALTSEIKVEQLARQNLNMHIPNRKERVFIYSNSAEHDNK